MVRIDEEYMLNATENCYTLEKISKVQDANSKNFGQEVKSVEGYYTTTENAINGYIKAKTREFISKEKENTLEELIQEINKFQNEVKGKFKNI